MRQFYSFFFISVENADRNR